MIDEKFDNALYTDYSGDYDTNERNGSDWYIAPANYGDKPVTIKQHNREVRKVLKLNFR